MLSQYCDKNVIHSLHYYNETIQVDVYTYKTVQEPLVIEVYQPDSIYLVRLVQSLEQNAGRPDINFWPSSYYTKETEICAS